MSPYYGVRRVGPYMGVIQVVDVGDACAYSTNGRSWRIRQQTSSGRFRWGIAQISASNMDDVRIVNADNLVAALRNLPPIPFPVRDRYELWLLHNRTRTPLALLRTCYKVEDMERVADPHWRPFVKTDTQFVSPTLQQLHRDKPGHALPTPHRDQLESQINEAARPLAVAQWFERQPDGSGIGHQGLRLNPDDIGHLLAADDFPELLISENWEDPLQAGLVEDYHDWYAASLLAHQNLNRRTRMRLEQAACRRPQSLLASYALIPEFLDTDAIEVALVSARLMNAS